MIAGYVLIANASVAGFNITLMIGNWLLLERIKRTHVQLDDAREMLRLQMVEHRKSLREVLRD